MKVELNVIGLDCAHCALTLEKYIAQVPGVISANINFSTSKLFIDVEEGNYSKVYKDIIKKAKEVNPSVKISKNKDDSSNVDVCGITMYIFGILLALIVMFANINNILYYVILIVSALCMGYKTYWKAILQLRHWKINENTLIMLSIIGAVAIGEGGEGLMVIALYTAGKMLEARAVNYSRKSISSLIDNQPEYAIILRDGKEVMIKPEDVVVGDTLIVRAGERVPLDGVVIYGEASIDNSHITGESLPVGITKGSNVISGSIVLDSVITLKVTSLYKDSAVSKILNMVSNATNNKSKTETVISKIASYYTLGVILSSLLVWGVVWIITGDITTAVYRGLIFLVVSCPCAFAISVPLTYFSGIGKCSRYGILVKGSNYIDACAGINKIVLDKTGTLTTGKFAVDKVSVVDNKITSDELLDIVVAGESKSNHPIAVAICEYYAKKPSVKVKKFREIAGIGIEYSINDNNYFVGRENSKNGKTIVAIKCNGQLIGNIELSDTIKTETKVVLEELHHLGLSTMMLTGDNAGVAKKVAGHIGITEYKAGLLPEDKFNIIRKQKDDGEKVGFVGDGLNDAPALTLSDVGISMGLMGSDATIEASDIVIADDNLKQLPRLIKIARKTKNIAMGNIIFSAVIKLSFLILGALGITGMAMAVFADVGVTILAILNALRVLVYKVK